MRLLIAIPALDYMHTSFVDSLVKLTARLRDDGVPHDVRICPGTLVYVARDKLAREAVRDGYTHVLWLDSDMVFTPELLDDLMFCGKSFVTGIAHSRRAPFCSCVFKNLTRLERYDYPYPRAAFQIEGCGFACVLIETAILSRVFNEYNTCFLPLPEFGEDLAFCKRWKDMGGEIWAEPSVQLGHVGHIVIYPSDAERLRGEIR